MPVLPHSCYMPRPSLPSWPLTQLLVLIVFLSSPTICFDLISVSHLKRHTSH
jgi:hypothetical protein